MEMHAPIVVFANLNALFRLFQNKMIKELSMLIPVQTAGLVNQSAQFQQFLLVNCLVLKLLSN